MDINKLAGDLVHRWRQKQGTDRQLKRAIVRAIRLALRQHREEERNGQRDTAERPIGNGSRDHTDGLATAQPQGSQ